MTVNVLNTLLVLTHVKLIIAPKDMGYYYAHFADEVKYFAQIHSAHK